MDERLRNWRAHESLPPHQGPFITTNPFLLCERAIESNRAGQFQRVVGCGAQSSYPGTASGLEQRKAREPPSHYPFDKPAMVENTAQSTSRYDYYTCMIRQETTQVDFISLRNRDPTGTSHIQTYFRRLPLFFANSLLPKLPQRLHWSEPA